MRIGTVCRARAPERRFRFISVKTVPEAVLSIGAAEKSPQGVPCGTVKLFNKVCAPRFPLLIGSVLLPYSMKKVCFGA